MAWFCLSIFLWDSWTAPADAAGGDSHFPHRHSPCHSPLSKTASPAGVKTGKLVLQEPWRRAIFLKIKGFVTFPSHPVNEEAVICRRNEECHLKNILLLFLNLFCPVRKKIFEAQSFWHMAPWPAELFSSDTWWFNPSSNLWAETESFVVQKAYMKTLTFWLRHQKKKQTDLTN